jgi:hypothetical protein
VSGYIIKLNPWLQPLVNYFVLALKTQSLNQKWKVMCIKVWVWAFANQGVDSGGPEIGLHPALTIHLTPESSAHRRLRREFGDLGFACIIPTYTCLMVHCLDHCSEVGILEIKTPYSTNKNKNRTLKGNYALTHCYKTEMVLTTKY